MHACVLDDERKPTSFNVSCWCRHEAAIITPNRAIHSSQSIQMSICYCFRSQQKATEKLLIFSWTCLRVIHCVGLSPKSNFWSFHFCRLSIRDEIKGCSSATHTQLTFALFPDSLEIFRLFVVDEAQFKKWIIPNKLLTMIIQYIIVTYCPESRVHQIPRNHNKVLTQVINGFFGMTMQSTTHCSVIACRMAEWSPPTVETNHDLWISDVIVRKMTILCSMRRAFTRTNYCGRWIRYCILFSFSISIFCALVVAHNI